MMASKKKRKKVKKKKKQVRYKEPESPVTQVQAKPIEKESVELVVRNYKPEDEQFIVSLYKDIFSKERQSGAKRRLIDDSYTWDKIQSDIKDIAVSKTWVFCYNELPIGFMSAKSVTPISAMISGMCSPDYKGRSMAVEAMRFSIKKSFETMPISRVFVYFSSRQLGLKRIADHAGMKECGHFRDADTFAGELADVYIYEHTRKDFMSNNEVMEVAG